MCKLLFRYRRAARKLKGVDQRVLDHILSGRGLEPQAQDTYNFGLFNAWRPEKQRAKAWGCTFFGEKWRKKGVAYLGRRR